MAPKSLYRTPYYSSPAHRSNHWRRRITTFQNNHRHSLEKDGWASLWKTTPRDDGAVRWEITCCWQQCWRNDSRRQDNNCTDRRHSLTTDWPASPTTTWNIYQISTGWPKNWHHILYALTLPNINRFSKLFHFQDSQNQEKICNNTITKDPTTPQVCRYTTLWNVKRFIDRAVGQWCRRLECVVQQQGGYIKHLM